MNVLVLGLCFLMTTAQSSSSIATTSEPAAARQHQGATGSRRSVEEKWRWMSERNVDALSGLFHEDAVFVHMGGTMSRSQELDVIRSGGIQCKHAEIQNVSVRIRFGTTAILLSRIRLVAVVGGNEVINPFVVTEVMCSRAVPGS